MEEKVLILDFGSQYTQLIARRLRELNVYSEIHPCTHIPNLDESTKAVILSGSPYSVNDGLLPNVDLSQYRGNLPLLGVCYGAQLLANQNGGYVVPSKIREYGRANLTSVSANPLFEGISAGSQVWMSHGDTIQDIPANFDIIASTESVKVAAFKIKEEETYAIQFHPEVTHSVDGKTLLHNFISKIAKLKQNWNPAHFIENTNKELKERKFLFYNEISGYSIDSIRKVSLTNLKHSINPLYSKDKVLDISIYEDDIKVIRIDKN
jgi:GMP synthase (glutamine-hydrolysing)